MAKIKVRVDAGLPPMTGLKFTASADIGDAADPNPSNDKDDWTITQLPENRGDTGDIYHVILLKKDGQWSIVHKPTLVLTTAEFKDVPLDILQDANRMGD